jgi:DNA-directed RNA polymerase subunit H (RpoH/RPB5)
MYINYIIMATTSSSSTIISKLYKSRKTLLDQLNYQGYNITNYEGFSINEVNIMYNKKQLDMLIESDVEPGAKVYVKYAVYKKLTENHIYEVISDLFEIENIMNKDTDKVIFVIKNEPNDTLMNIQNHLWHSDKYFISVLNIDRLQYNILKHTLVPEHTILKEEETKDFYEKFNIINGAKQLPTISRFDPVAQVIGLRPGQVCKINRNSQTTVQTTYYRICE